MAKELTLKSTEVSPKAFGKVLNGKRNNEGQQAQEGIISPPPSSAYIGTGKAIVPTVKSRSRPFQRRNRSLTRTPPQIKSLQPTVWDTFFLGSFPKDACNLYQWRGFGPSASDLALEGLLLGIGHSGVRPEVNPSLKNIS